MGETMASATVYRPGLSPEQASFYSIVVRQAAGCTADCRVRVRGIPDEHDVLGIVTHETDADGPCWLKTGQFPFHQGVDPDVEGMMQQAGKKLAALHGDA